MVKFVDGDEHLWLDPAYEEVRKLIADGAAEIAKNYDVDGIHYDDYFYPSKGFTNKKYRFFKIPCYSKRKKRSFLCKKKS